MGKEYTEIDDGIQRLMARFRCIAIFITLFLPLTMLADNAEHLIEGTWLSADGTGWIKIEMGEDGPVGSIAGSPDDRERSDKDELNPDPALRDRALLGLTIMDGFTAAGEGRWKSGRIYDPNSGKTYKCKLTLVDANTLELRGYIGISLLGRTETWSRRE